jgi:hypothetical protein
VDASGPRPVAFANLGDAGFPQHALTGVGDKHRCEALEVKMPHKNRPPKGQNPRGGKREGAGRPPGPIGRGAAFKHLRELARSHTEEAVLTIVNIMRKSKDGWLRLACANAILDRSFGKPRQGEVVEQEDILTMKYPTLADIEADLIARGLPIDHLRAPKLIEHDNER